MRTPCRFLLLFCLLSAALLAATPAPARDAPAAGEVEKLIDQLGSDDADKRQAATKKLEEIGDPALELLPKAVKSHPDVDVRLRAAVLARKISERGWGEIRHFGTGAGYWLNRCAFTPDGKQAVVTGGGVIVYDLEKGEELRRSMELTF